MITSNKSASHASRGQVEKNTTDNVDTANDSKSVRRASRTKSRASRTKSRDSLNTRRASHTGMIGIGSIGSNGAVYRSTSHGNILKKMKTPTQPQTKFAVAVTKQTETKSSKSHDVKQLSKKIKHFVERKIADADIHKLLANVNNNMLPVKAELKTICKQVDSIMPQIVGTANEFIDRLRILESHGPINKMTSYISELRQFICKVKILIFKCNFLEKSTNVFKICDFIYTLCIAEQKKYNSSNITQPVLFYTTFHVYENKLYLTDANDELLNLLVETVNKLHDLIMIMANIWDSVLKVEGLYELIRIHDKTNTYISTARREYKKIDDWLDDVKTHIPYTHSEEEMNFDTFMQKLMIFIGNSGGKIKKNTDYPEHCRNFFTIFIEVDDHLDNSLVKLHNCATAFCKIMRNKNDNDSKEKKCPPPGIKQSRSTLGGGKRTRKNLNPRVNPFRTVF